MSQRFLGCQSALRHFATVRTEYQQSFKSVERIKETIERLEFQVAKINQVGEEVVMKLSEQYYELKQVRHLIVILNVTMILNSLNRLNCWLKKKLRC
jgi:uncharacterized protein (UPF0335 family)